MIIKYYLTFLLAFVFNGLWAQDTIYNVNSSKRLAKVIEISNKQVKYKNPENPDGPVYILERKNIFKIVYANGTVDTLTRKSDISVELAKKKSLIDSAASYKKNTLYFVVSDLFSELISIGFERKFRKGTFSYRIPFSLRFGNAPIPEIIFPSFNTTYDYSFYGYYDSDKIFSTGINLYYYPGGQRRFSYGFGPALTFGMFHYKTRQLVSENPYPFYEEISKIGSYTGLTIGGLVNYNVTEWFALSCFADAGMGMTFQKVYKNEINSKPYSSSTTIPLFYGGIQVGFKF